jgi:heme A synthase
MIITIVKVLSAISLVPFFVILLRAAQIWRALERSRRKQGISSWSEILLRKSGEPDKKAEDIINDFKQRTLGVALAIVIILAAFIFSYLHPDGPKTYWYAVLILGLLGGWNIAYECVNRGFIAVRHFLSEK